METKILNGGKKNIKIAANEIKTGKVVAFATETVYGLGADAFNEQAVIEIFKIKGRPNDNPLIVHLSCVKDIEKIAYVDKRAKMAIKKFMPGALTVILKRKDGLAPSVTCGLDTVAVRVPKNKIALKFLRACSVPVAAPSANSSTKPSPTLASHVYDDLNGKIGYILDGGQCGIGVESTIIDFSGERIRLLRKGGIPAEKLEKLLGKMDAVSGLDKNEKPISPGMKYLHYAPKAKVVTFNYGDLDDLERLRAANGGKKIVILSLSAIPGACVFKNVRIYAKRLFLEFRLADKLGAELIICERPLEKGIGAAVNNRIAKASGDNLLKDNSYERQGE